MAQHNHADDEDESDQFDPDDENEVATDGGQSLVGRRAYVASRGEGEVVEENVAGHVGVRFDDRLGETTTYVEREEVYVRLQGDEDDADDDDPELVTDGGRPVVDEDDDTDSEKTISGAFVDTPRCPECGSFLWTDYDPHGFPVAGCSRTTCTTQIGVDELIDRGYYVE